MAKFLENKASIQKQVKPKKKKKEETVVKKAQSPSVSKNTQQTVNRLNQKYGGGSTKPQTVKKPNAGAKKTAQPVTQQTRQKTVDRLSTKYGQNKVERQEPKRRFQPETTERISKNPRMLDTASNVNPDRDPQNAANRAARNTPTIAKESLKQVAAGHGKTAADITSMNQSSNIGAKIDIKSKEFQEDIQRRRVKSTEAANKAYDEISKIQDKSEQNMQKLTKDAKGLEKAYYGALESGIGMATDQMLGPAWAVSMMSRTYGNTRGKAQQEGATENEDRANALLQGAKEVATEYLFRGVGLASKLSGAKSLSPSERIAKAATKNMTGTAANVTHAGIRLLGGTAEENIEELIGWGLDPLISEAAYKRNVRTREAQQMLKDQSDSLRSNITSEEDARSIAAYLGSDDFIESNMKTYMDSGIGETEARELAEKMRDYLTASLTGDTEAMADIEEELSKTLSGKGLSKESWSLSELMDTVASTTLLTMTTGLPGSVSTAARGAAFLENNSNERIRALADTAIDFENKEMSAKAEAMRDRLDAGQELTSTQAYDLMQGVAEQYAKDSDRQQAAYRVADNTIRDDKLVAPFEVTRNGNLRMGEVTNKEYRSNTREAKKSITGFIKSDSSESITEEQIDRGSRAIAGFKTGVFTVDDANELNYRNTAVRDAFKAETGIDLNEYIVKGKNGEVDIPATNTATKNALFALAAENLVVSAQAETENWMDNTKGEVVAQISNRMGAQGLVDLQYVLDDVDERDRATYMMTANMADVMYQQGRNLGLEWDAVKADAKRLAPGIPQEKLREMYEAGRFDRDRASDKARGQQIKVGEKIALAKDNEAPMGQVLIDTDKPVKGTVIRAFSEVAKNLGVDIHLVDHFTDKDGNVLKNVNGEYINGAIYINVNSKFEKNIGYIFMHEVTHHLKTFAPEQYNELENLVRERWFKYDAAQMQNEIAKKIEAYERNGQTLTEEQALEEIIADAAHEFLNDRNFANAVAEENPTLAQAVLNSIRNALRMLRRVLATGSIDDETHMNTLFSQLDILDEAERLWLGAYTQAVKNKAAVDLNRLQDRIYEEGRKSITADAEQEISSANTSINKNKLPAVFNKVEWQSGTTNFDNGGGKFDNASDFLATKGVTNYIYDRFNRSAEHNQTVSDALDERKADTGTISNVLNVIAEKASRIEVLQNSRDNVKPGGEIYITVYEGDGSGIGRETSSGYQLNMKLRDYLPEVQEVFPEAYIRKGMIVAPNNGVLSQEQQETLENETGPNIRFSTTTEFDVLPKAAYTTSAGYSGYAMEASGRQLRHDLNEKNFSKEQADAVDNYMKLMADWFDETGEGSLQYKYQFIGWQDLTDATVQVKRNDAGEIVGVTVSAMVKNGEYPVNFDLTTVCNKREGVTDVIKNLMNTKVPGTNDSVLNSIKLSDKNMWKINQALKAEGIDTACLGCFVEARRYYAQNFMDKIDDKWNSAVRKARRQLGLPENEYFNFAHGRAVTGEEWSSIDSLWTKYEESTESKSSPADRIKILMDEIVRNKEVDSPYLKLIQLSDILTPEGINGFKQLSNKGHDMVKTIKSIYGTSAPKEILAFTPYNSEIALLPDQMKGMDTPDYLRSIGGIRVQSFSDFKIEHVYEHFQMVADEAARKFVTHGYSKVIAFPRIFGLTGRKINMSVMFDVLPNKAWSQALGIPVRKARKYAKMYQGLQFVKEKPKTNIDNRPYKEIEIEGVHGYLTYLVSDADYVNSVYDRLYQENIDAGMNEAQARRKANEAKPFEQSINYREAVELENKEGYKENVGIIAVAYGDEHLKMLLADPNVRYVIPYHKSGLPTFISKKTSLAIARDYTNFQNTNIAETWKDANGKAVDFKKEYKKFLKDNADEKYPAIKFFKQINDSKYTVKFGSKDSSQKAAMAGTADFDVYKDLDKVSEIQEVSNAYLEHCIKNGWCPIFHEFAGDPNYYKMLFDFAVTDQEGNIYPQKVVRNVYPGIDIDAKVAAGEEITADDLAELKKVVEQGAEEQNRKNMIRAQNMPNVMNDLLSRNTENSIISDTNIQSIQYNTPDYTDVKYGNPAMTPEETDADVKMSISEDFDDAYMDAVNSGDMDEAQRLVGEAAKVSGLNSPLLYHGTYEQFTTFKGNEFLSEINGLPQIKGYFSEDRDVSEVYGDVSRYYVGINNPLDFYDVPWSQTETEWRKWFESKGVTNIKFDSSIYEDTLKEHINDRGENEYSVFEIFDGADMWAGDGNLTERIAAAGYDGMRWDYDEKAWIPFDDKRIKSADTVTYAEDGSVIPLSERFDPSNDDIRYSLPTQDSDGNILSDGQMEYFKNSQARDSQGRLVPVYHTTNRGGFTIFDPSYSDDKRSLFFASNWDVSQTYGDYGANHRVEFAEPEDIRNAEDFPFIYQDVINKGYYEVYLNLEKPLIVDAQNQSWNNIPYGEYSEDAVLAIKNLTVQDMGDGIYVNIWGDRKVDGKWQEFRESDTIEFEYLTVDGEYEIPERAWDEVYDFLVKQGLSSDYAYEHSDAFFDFNGLDTFDKDGRKVESDVRRYRTRELAALADAKGYDSVIVRNCYDIGAASHLKGEGLSDIYIAFSSNQVKDINNENPTENPDIRYSFTEDEINSRKDYDYASSDTYEMLEMYEDMLSDEDMLDEFVDASDEKYYTDYFMTMLEKYGKSDKRARKTGKTAHIKLDNTAEAIDAFYSSLTPETRMVYDDEMLEEGRKRMATSKQDFWNHLNAKWNDRWLSGGEVLKVESVKNDVMNLVMGIMDQTTSGKKYKTEIVKKTLIDMRLAYQFMKQDRTDAASALLYHSALRMIENVDFIEDDTEYQNYKGLRDYLRNTRIHFSEEYWNDVGFQEYRKRNMSRIKIVKGPNDIDKGIYSELQRQWPEYFSEEEMRKNGYKMNVPGMMSQLDYVLNLQVDPVTYAYSSEECAQWAFDIADDLYSIMEKGVAVNSLADQYEARNEANIAAEREKADKRVANEKAKAEKDIAAEKAKTEKAVLTAKGYKEKFDEEARAMKTRHAEAILRIRKAKEEGIAAEKAHFKEYKEQQREQKYHTKYFDSISDSHKKLTERLTTNTKDKHIPEQYKKQLAKLLAAFDLQTVGSKKLEIKKGLYYRQNYKSQKTIKMQAIKNALINIEANSPLFEINDSITDIIDRLLGKNEKGEYKDELSIEGKTIDALSASELKDIDNLLKALIHEFNYYESVRVGIKRQQAADIGSEQIKICLNHVEEQGEGKDWQNFLGHMDNILSLDEVTPAYMFRMIDRENTGIGTMFKELRRAFGKYVKNQEQLNKWMDDILGEYHNNGKLWNKYGSDQISDWRLARSAREFRLESGKTISLTPAQMMSIYCLSNRPQALDHMTGAGVVIQPVTFMAKMETDLKRKANPAIPAQLTMTDITNIKNQLTPDQIKVADKLQKLMANEMAEWGNEASMAVIGIRLFEDRDYFPIKSDKAALEKDFSANQFTEAIRNFGFTKAVQPGASNSIAIGDIFDVVAEHCNQMNLYNAYSEAMNDFMKVYNYHERQDTETGYTDYSVEQAIAYAFSKKATTYIGTFMKDLNGNVSKERMTGIEGLTNDLLGKAKKTSVFANGRVALQQPTAFVRAFAVIDPKYIKGVSVTNATMREMFEHSPIALWKSWGFYDINMGKSVEDLMMNNGNWLEDWMTDLYGKLDNRTWAAIWGMCKAEIEDKHKDVKAGTDEYWELVSGRFDEVIDLTQVVDSPFHRSHAMRSKSIFTKMFTAFMAEPTLTFNMVRDGLIHAREQSKLGNKAEAGKIRARAIGTFIASAVFTSAAAAIWDAVRGKDPESWLGKLLGADDDDDKNVFEKWWANFLNNVQDNLNLFNNIYYVKDIMSYFQGWEQRPLYTQGFKHFSDMKKQLCGERVSSNLSWWQNLVAGVGYLTGLPLKTVMNDFNKVWKGGFGLFGITAPEPFLPALEQLDSIGESAKDMNRGESSTATSTTGESSSAKKKSSSASSTTSVNLWTYDNAPFRITDGSLADTFLNHFGINLTAAELKSMERAEARKKMQKEVDDIKEKTADLTGEAKSKKVWSYVTTFHKEQNGDKALSDFIEAGDFDEIENLRSMYVRCGGDTDYFEERIYAGAKKALKKSIIGDPTAEQIEAQWNIKNYLTGHGMSASEMSEIAYKSDTARDLKVAFRINDEEAMVNELVPLIRAGLTREDYERLYKNRNRLNLKTYDGKYKDRLKSTGTYNWPINGQITSGFGHRSSPGGIGSTNHQGLDIAGSMGDPVAAADGGTVVYAGWYGGAGKTVMIEHDDGVVTQYSHLSWWDAKVGDTVAQGQTIGNVGSTGNSTGPHLHFGVKVNGSYVNPLDYLN